MNGILIIKSGVLICSYDEDDMKKFALHLLVLSHSFAVPLLKKVCTQYLEECWLNTENVIDILQLARKCDAPRLTFMCTRLVVRQFKAVASTEGWKVMRRVDPALEQELLESVVESDSVSKLSTAFNYATFFSSSS
jgi:hypothetical protein